MPSKAEARGTGKEPDWNRAPPAFIDSSTDSAARSPPANPRLSPPAAASSSAAGRRSACAQGSSPAAGRSSRLKRGGKCSLTPVNEPHRDFHTPPLRDSRLPSRSERCWRYCWLSLVKACSSFTACCSSSSCKTKALTGKNTAKKKKKIKENFPPNSPQAPCSSRPPPAHPGSSGSWVWWQGLGPEMSGGNCKARPALGSSCIPPAACTAKVIYPSGGVSFSFPTRNSSKMEGNNHTWIFLQHFPGDAVRAHPRTDIRQ